MIIEMEPTAHLSYSNPKQPDVAAANIGKGHRRLVADLKLTSSLSSTDKDGGLGWKGAYVRFGNTEPGAAQFGQRARQWQTVNELACGESGIVHGAAPVVCRCVCQSAPAVCALCRAGVL